MTTCKAPFILNSETKKCEMWNEIPPEHCASNDKKEFLYSLKYNSSTKKCEGEDDSTPKKKITDFPVCIPGTTELPSGWCKKVTTTVEPRAPSEDDEPPGSSQNMFSKLMAKMEHDENKATETEQKSTTNILIFLFIIFIIFGAGIYFLFKK